MIELRLKVKNVVYSREAFTVLAVVPDGKKSQDLSYDLNLGAEFTIKAQNGQLMQYLQGDKIVVSGEVGEYQGKKQFVVHTAKLNMSFGSYEYTEFLSRRVHGLGQILADRIAEHFGDETYSIVSKDPLRLQEVRGISKAKALDFAEQIKWIASADEDIAKFFARYDISEGLQRKIVAKYSKDYKRIIQEDPYRLMLDIEGVAFTKADNIGLQVLGGNKEHPLRIRAGIIAVIENLMQNNGHTLIVRDDLYAQILYRLELANNEEIKKIFDESIEYLKQEEDILAKIVEIKESDKIYYMRYINYIRERNIAKLLHSFMRVTHKYNNIAEQISDLERRYNIKLADEQRRAIEASLFQSVSIITGGPGTGKTTLIKFLIKILHSLKKNVKLTAPTGRAARRMEESTGSSAQTIHRLLGIQPNSSGNFDFTYNKYNKLACDAIIVDEMSMCEPAIFLRLLEALKSETIIILVGDKDQLPSVAPGNLLGDLISSGYFTTTTLRFIYRQGDTSSIARIAHDVVNSKNIVINEEDTECHMPYVPTSDAYVKNILMYYEKFLKKYSFDEVEILSPMKAGEFGVENLNRIIQNNYNPRKDLSKTIIFKDKNFELREKDKVINNKNNYQIEWTKNGEVGKGIFNGEIGIVSSVNSATEIIYVDFDSKIAKFNRNDISTLSLGYAITVHKAQGSEFKSVIYVDASGSRLSDRTIFYTAITRAREELAIISNKKIIARSIRNNQQTMRITLLPKVLQYYFGDLESLDIILNDKFSNDITGDISYLF